jgi:predicted DNA-binding protein (UPF0251 family)
VTARRPQSLDRPARAGEPDEGPELSGGEDPAFAHVDDTLALEGLMAPLSEHERLVLRLRFQEDLVQGEIGERLGISQMQVSCVIRRSIHKLPGSQPRAAAVIAGSAPTRSGARTSPTKDPLGIDGRPKGTHAYRAPGLGRHWLPT